MIQVVGHGLYKLIETRNQIKILSLEDIGTFAWIHAEGIGEILVTSHKPHATDYILSYGTYRLYAIKNEKEFTDLMHLELSVGCGVWQGYLLPTGMPTDEKKRIRLVPTKETVTQSIPLRDLS